MLFLFSFKTTKDRFLKRLNRDKEPRSGPALCPNVLQRQKYLIFKKGMNLHFDAFFGADFFFRGYKENFLFRKAEINRRQTYGLFAQ